MATRNLDIDLLRSFAAVADSGSFTAAGELVARTLERVIRQTLDVLAVSRVAA